MVKETSKAEEMEYNAYRAACIVQIVKESLNAVAMGCAGSEDIPAAACIALEVVEEMLQEVYDPKEAARA